jgi:preprotein translocase subunit SecY
MTKEDFTMAENNDFAMGYAMGQDNNNNSGNDWFGGGGIWGLLIIALLPMILGCIGFNAGANASGQATNWAYALTFFSFSGNSLLIVVGVVLETVREIEAQMTMRNFKGFLE